MSEIMGIDVSHYQHTIDWSKVKAQGKQFAIMKCMYEAQSHRIDETFEYNYRECGVHGIARGVYIFIASSSLADPVNDAKSLLNHLKGRKLEYGIWLDYESDVLRSQGKEKIKELTYIYADIFKSAGYYVGIYCNQDWFNNVIPSQLKKEFDFWIARYPEKDVGKYNSSSRLKPTFKEAVAWQYSSKGRVDGIQGVVDLDVDFDGVINLVIKNKPTHQEDLVSVSNPYSRTTDLIKRGMKGEAVKWLQYELNRHGASLNIDGDFKNKTLSAVISFQQKHPPLKIDGIVGVKTIAELQK